MRKIAQSAQNPEIVAFVDYRLQARHGYRRHRKFALTSQRNTSKDISAQRNPLRQAGTFGVTQTGIEKMVALGNIDEWQPPHGPVTTWTVSSAAREAARTAGRSDLPPSYQRKQHLWTAHDGNAMSRQQPRLMIVAWDIPGRCDIPAMTAAINWHVRRHDAYHDWFEFENGGFVRRTIDNPEVIDLVPVESGHMTPEQVRTHALTTTPPTLEWGCFTFGIVEHTDYFTFYASVDHLHIDGMSSGLIFFDIHLMYEELRRAGRQHRPTTASEMASYRDYAARQHEYVAGLSLSSPEIKEWIDFVHDTDGNWPSFPLPLGDTQASSKGDLLTVELLDAAGTESFDTACLAAGARFSSGVVACTALAEQQLTGADTYHGFVPYDTRISGVDTMTVGWFASLVPVTVPTGTGSFSEAARAAQKSLDTTKHLASVPFQRVLELATPDQLGIEPHTHPATMVSFLDFRKIPVVGLWEQTNFGIYGDNLSLGGINMWINRHAKKTTVTISFPDNPIARESVDRYIAVLKKAFENVVESNSGWVESVVDHANSLSTAA